MSNKTQERLLAEINPLAKKKRDGVATAAELQKLDALHAEYIANFRAMLNQQLDNTVIVYPDGKRESLKNRKKQ